MHTNLRLAWPSMLLVGEEGLSRSIVGVGQ